MLDALKHWFAKPAADDVATLLRQWSPSQGGRVRSARQQNGCVVHGPHDAWRLEWGPSQRSYMPSPELRWMAPVSLPADRVLLLLQRSLAETLERAVYEQYVDDVQTRVDTDAPVEMRWLVVHPRLGNQDLGSLRTKWTGVASDRDWAQRWLTVEVQQALLQADQSSADGWPMTLAIGRGRLALRTHFPVPDAPRLQAWHQAFSLCLQQIGRAPD